MPRKTLTDRALRTHRPEAREEWTDTIAPGLVARFGTGDPVLYVRFKERGRTRRVKIGKYPAVTLPDARERARAIIRYRDSGAGPIAGTVSDLAAAFVENRRTAGELQAGEVERILRTDVLPEIGTRMASAIRPANVAAILDKLVARGAPTQANRTRSHLVRLFRFGIERGYCETNPAQVLRPPHKERSRDRYLSDEEIAALWSALETRHPSLRHLFRLLLLTALRPGEGRLLTWGEIQSGEIRLPAERTKARRPHTLPLTPLALSVLEAQRPFSGAGDHIFPSPAAPGSPIHPDSLSHFARNLGRVLGFTFRPNDLRRTAATGMGRLGVERFIRKLILNHADPDVHGVYDRYRYQAEIRSALKLWSAHVQSLLPATHAATSDSLQPMRAGES